MKKRVFELAKDLGITSKELIEQAKKFNIELKSHMSAMDEKTVELVMEKLTSVEKKEEKKSKITPTAKTKTQPVIPKAAEPVQPMAKEEKAAIKAIKVAENVTVAELAAKIETDSASVIKFMLQHGKFLTINQSLDSVSIETIGKHFNYSVDIIAASDEEFVYLDSQSHAKHVPRPPVVTIMGHVDHGKTSLLDAIRRTNVTAQEAGGITQHIGAYAVDLSRGKVIFLDTPGHEAFTKLRARGAQVTDVVVLVVAADDGVMPQTVEAIDHAKAAKVPIVVAVNKIDKPDANIEKVRRELANYDLAPEEWGGKTIFVDVSAKKGTGLDKLLEMLLLEAEMLELKAPFECPARGTVIESKMEKGRGVVATILIREGTLSIGDCFVGGLSSGKVKAMLNDKGEKITTAGPSIPVEILGFTTAPAPGEKFIVVKDERTARQICARREEIVKAKAQKPHHVTLEELYGEIQKGRIKELHLIIKADVQGSVEALSNSLQQLSTEKIIISIIHKGIGDVNESDIVLAAASDAIIIGFGVKISPKINTLAEEEGVEVKCYKIIYEAINDIKLAMQGMLEPVVKEVVTGKCEVRQLFGGAKSALVIGCFVTEGKICIGDKLKLIRKGEVIFNGAINSLRRFKDDVKEVTNSFECGISIDNIKDIKQGDIIEVYTIEKKSS